MNPVSVETKELNANYVNVNKNISLCNNAVNELTYSKASKMDKLEEMIGKMEEVGKELVFFETYKESIKNMGCSAKEIDLYEKEIFKRYVPLKKQLQKVLKVNFENITTVVVDEKEYSNDEINLEAFEEDE